VTESSDGSLIEDTFDSQHSDDGLVVNTQEWVGCSGYTDENGEVCLF
jgi:hypothetical protein